MTRLTALFLFVIFIAIFAITCSKKTEQYNVSEQVAKFAPVTIKYDQSLLDETESKALKKIVDAAKLMDDIFLRQVYSKNAELREKLMASTDPADKSLQQLFDIMVGPFDRLEADKPFIGTAPKPLGANFYPEDMTKEEFNAWIEAHPADREQLEHTFTRIQRRGDQLVAVPYSEAYRQWLEPAAVLLQDAAEITGNASLATYLNSRAEAFGSNDYYQSDMDWMDLYSRIEVVIGPYEVYEDKLFGYKAAFEAFVTLVDPAESEKLAIVGKYLDKLEENWPIKNEYKNFNRGEYSPVKVVQEVFSAGDTKAGVQTLAFNLPNDERVREAKGSKKVMLKNIAEAKFNKIYMPIARIVLDETMLPMISFDRWFTHILMHETTHGLGPGMLTLEDGTKTTVQKMLQETYSAIEECKADVGGLYTFAYLCKKGVFPEELEPGIYATYLAGIFRSVRFGAEEAHGKANMIAFNYLMGRGGFVYDSATGKFSVDDTKIRAAVRELIGELLTIQAEGDYKGACNLLETYASMPECMQTTLPKLAHVPVDIKPEFEVLEEL
ncbi:peptidase [candidate division KSB1 bacterium]|nr:peptidase [candidate division KSB1 bacterium]